MKGENSLRSKSLSVLFIFVCLAAILISGCAKATTSTVTSTVTIQSPGATVTLPGGLTTIPAITVTLPGGLTTIPAITVTIPPVTNTPPPSQVSGGFLPNTPVTITAHKDVIGTLTGACLICHGQNGMYNQFPLPPSWDGADNGSSHNIGFYIVVPGSIQDHTDRTADECLTCHAVA